MVYGCGNKTVKFLVFIVNFLICLAGGAVMGVGIAANLNTDFMKKLQDAIDTYNLGDDLKLANLTTAIWCLVAVGAFLFLTGFLGCCGAACENRCLLGVFFVIVLILFIAELGAGIAALVLQGKMKEEIKKGIEDMYDALSNNKTLSDQSLIKFEEEIKCCGIQSNPGTWGDGTKDHCPKPKSGPEYNNCVDVLWDLLKKYAVPAGAVAVGVLVIELLAMIFSCVMCNAISQKSSYRGYA